MIDFKFASLKDKAWINELLANAGEKGCDYTFGTLYSWQEYYEIRVGEAESCLAVKFGSGADAAYLFPVGPGNIKHAVLDLKRDAAQAGGKLRFYSVSRENADFLEREFPGAFERKLDRAGQDYLYEINSLCELAGKKYHAKKNHVNRFMRDFPDWSFEPITSENIEECRSMDKLWVTENTGYPGEESLEGESKALEICFNDFENMGLEGGILRCGGGQTAAFTIGEPICGGECYDVHYEKALQKFQGAYSVINQQFARFVRSNHPECKYLNREDDMGLDGLRQAKESYHPAILLEEYIVWEK